MTNASKVQQMREECVRHNIDLSRAKVVVKRQKGEDGYEETVYEAVHEPSGIPLDESVVQAIRGSIALSKDPGNPRAAEHKMLYIAYHTQIEERLRVRMGRVRGMDTYQMRTTPLSKEEIDDYLKDMEKRRQERLEYRRRQEAELPAAKQAADRKVVEELDLLYGNVEVKAP